MNGAGEKQPGERRLRSQIHAEFSMVGVGSSEDMGLFRRITWNSVVGVELRGRDRLSKLTGSHG